jgi:N-acetylglutamate synthase-like GNAT family acetyltransferase
VAGNVVIRQATAADAKAIRAIIRDADLNRHDLDWRRFVVADDGGVVATAQVRVHAEGTREVASVAVVTDRRQQGIGTRVAEAVIAREEVRPLWLCTGSDYIPFWERLGFSVVDPAAAPADLAASIRISRRLVARAPGRSDQPVVMRRYDP